MNQRHTTGLMEIHLAVLLFGLAGLFGKFLELPAWAIVLGRTGYAALVLGIVILARKGTHRRLSAKTVGLFALLGLVLAVHWVTFFHAIQVSTVAVGLLAYSTFPVFITIVEPWWFHEPRRAVDMLTAVLVLLGLGIMVYPSPVGGQVFRGVAWGTLSGFAFAVLSLLNRKWVQDHPPVVIAFYQNAFAAMMLLPVAIRADLHVDADQLGLLALLGIFCTALAHALFIRGLTYVRAQLASIIACLEPVYGIVLAFVWLHEIPTVHTLAGGAMILATAAVAMNQRASV